MLARSHRLWVLCALLSTTSLVLPACGDDDNVGDDAAIGDGPGIIDGAGADAVDLDALLGDGGGGDGAGMDGLPPTMSITEIQPPAASRQVNTTLTILGSLLQSGATVTLTNCDDPGVTYTLAGVMVDPSGNFLTVVLPGDVTRVQGLYTVTVTNPDGQTDELMCAFRILAAAPPTVTNVTPPSAYAGSPADGVSSDELVTITGTGFESTPAVRWIKTDGSKAYDALLVGFVSDTQITAVTPSETLHMEAGQYHVWVTNPSLLGAQWIVPSTMMPGIFTITTTPPPIIGDVQPPRVENGSCTTTNLTITGSGFSAMATVWYLVPPGTTCTGSVVDANGNTLCPMAVTSAASGQIVANWTSCPGTGPWPLAVMNPDGQTDYFFSVQVTPSSDGHLNVGAFVTLPNGLAVPRWKHGAAYGFDAFGNAYLYVAGGQDAAAAVLGSVEASRMDIFGNPGPFAVTQQFQDAANPRVVNSLARPRQGATLVRAGRDLFMIGGAFAPTDVAAAVAATTSVERARILSYKEMPSIQRPVQGGAMGLPTGSWYYQVSALGPWGEGLASREVVALDTGGVLHVCWDAPSLAGTTGYNLYRSLAADGRAGTTTLLASNIAPAAMGATCFDDDGAAGLTPAPGRLRGNVAVGAGFAAGTYRYRVSATTGAGETHAGYPVAVDVTAADVTAGNAAIRLTWDAVAGATAYGLYRFDGGTGEYVLLDTGALTMPTFLDTGVAFAASGLLPRDTTPPLPAGSLSRWAEVTPSLNTAREGLDGVLVTMDPATSGGLVGRILVAGGRTDNSGGAGTYLKTAESLGIHDDGTLDAAWFDEAPQFTNARVYYALVTTQDRNTTPFPPPPEEPPCGDLDGDGYLDCACAPAGSMPDCNDADPSIHPGAMEICGDGLDQDCDLPASCSGTDVPCSCTTDVDMDMHYPASCGGDDCCDTGLEAGVLGCTVANAPGIHGGALEVCGDGIDQDCDGVDPPCMCNTDVDMDGHVSIACGGDDCCDTGADVSAGCTSVTAPGIHPGALDICGNGIDEDCDGVQPICSTVGPGPGRAPPPMSLPRLPRAPAAPPDRTLYDLVATEPVYVVAVFGDDVFAASNNQGRDDFEACLVDAVTGHLACSQWQVQGDTDPQQTFGMDAVLYFSYLYPFYGVNRETTGAPTTRTFLSSAIGRFPVLDLVTATMNLILGNRQSASTSFELNRSYYQMTRLMSYVFVIGGWGDTSPPGPTGTVERHIQ